MEAELLSPRAVLESVSVKPRVLSALDCALSAFTDRTPAPLGAAKGQPLSLAPKIPTIHIATWGRFIKLEKSPFSCTSKESNLS